MLRSRLPDLVHQEIWAYLIVHHAISALTARASAAADLDPDRISFAQALRLIRRTATGTADIPPRTGLTGSRPTWPRSPPLLIPTGGNAPAPARSNAPDTTATGSRSPASPPAPATPPGHDQTSADPRTA